MSLTVAVQMDPLEKINISGDSTFAIMLGAQARGHKLFHYLAEDMTWQDGRLFAGAHEVSVQPVPGDHYRLGEFAILDLGSDVDVVLLDIVMPVLDGFATLEALKADDRLRDLPVIVISDVDDRPSIVRCIRMGAADHLPKTVDPEILQARIHASLG